MAFSYLTPENLKDIWKESEKSMQSLLEPLKENERLSRNKPHPGIDKAYPKVTDGTTAAIIEETPKRVIQQIPTGKVETTLGEWFDLYANWKLVEDIIPNANCQADVLQKSWKAISSSMTYGSQPAYVFMDTYNGRLLPNFKLPYVTHVYYQKGKVSDKESKIMFMESWYQTTDIEYIISREEQLKKDGLETSGWDIKKLKEIKNKKSAKNEDQQNPVERENDKEDAEGIRVIHAFQEGVEAEFYSFESETGDILRTKKNTDRRGQIPLEILYYIVDLSSPIGRSLIDFVGGMQNLLDSHTQAFQYMQALMYNPPLKKRGDLPQGALKYVPNAIWDMGDSPGNEVEPVQINTQALSNFPQTFGLVKSQILNLGGTQDTSVSAESGNPGFSKTQAGVEALQNRLGVSDNYIRKQFEQWFGRVCETMLNLNFAEITGMVQEDLDPKTASKLRELIPEGNDVITWLDEESDSIIVDYDQLGGEPIYFNVDAATSKARDDSEQIEAITAFMELMQGLGGLPPAKQMALVNRLVDKFGLEDPEDIKFSEEEINQVLEQEQLAQMQAEQQAMMQEQMAQEEAMMPPEAEVVPDEELSVEEEELVIALGQRGFDEMQIQEAVTAMRQGLPTDQVVAYLMEAN